MNYHYNLRNKLVIRITKPYYGRIYNQYPFKMHRTNRRNNINRKARMRARQTSKRMRY